MAEAQAGIVEAAARASRRASGSFSASWMMEAGRTAISLWKAGLDSSVVIKLLSSVITFDALRTIISNMPTRYHALFR